VRHLGARLSSSDLHLLINKIKIVYNVLLFCVGYKQSHFKKSQISIKVICMCVIYFDFFYNF
jgi:hypothetical protein